MSDSMQGAYTAGLLAAGGAGVEKADDEEANHSIIGRLARPAPTQRDTDGTPVGASDAAADAEQS